MWEATEIIGLTFILFFIFQKIIRYISHCSYIPRQLFIHSALCDKWENFLTHKKKREKSLRRRQSDDNGEVI